MSAPSPGPELTAEERDSILAMYGPEEWACKLLRLYDDAEARVQSAELWKERHKCDAAALEATEFRLAAAVELLERLNTWNETERSTGDMVSICRDTAAFLSTAPAQAAEPAAESWCDREGCSVAALDVAESRLRECRAEAATWRERMHATRAKLRGCRTELVRTTQLNRDALDLLFSKDVALESTRAELDLLKQDYAGVVADRHGLSAELAVAATNYTTLEAQSMRTSAELDAARERIEMLSTCHAPNRRAESAETALRDLRQHVRTWADAWGVTDQLALNSLEALLR